MPLPLSPFPSSALGSGLPPPLTSPSNLTSPTGSTPRATAQQPVSLPESLSDARSVPLAKSGPRSFCCSGHVPLLTSGLPSSGLPSSARVGGDGVECAQSAATLHILPHCKLFLIVLQIPHCLTDSPSFALSQLQSVSPYIASQLEPSARLSLPHASLATPFSAHTFSYHAFSSHVFCLCGILSTPFHCPSDLP